MPVRITNIEEIMGDHESNSNRVKRELSETPEKLRGARREKITPEKKRSCGRAIFLPEEVIDIVESDEENLEEAVTTVSSESDVSVDDQHTLAPDMDQGDESSGMLPDDPPIFRTAALSFEEVSVLLLDPSKIPKDKIGHTVPSGLYVGDSSYVIDLRSLKDAKDIRSDRLGAYGKTSTCPRGYVSENDTWRRVDRYLHFVLCRNRL